VGANQEREAAKSWDWTTAQYDELKKKKGKTHKTEIFEVIVFIIWPQRRVGKGGRSRRERVAAMHNKRGAVQEKLD